MVHVSTNLGKTWSARTVLTPRILVIQPGAGCGYNGESYTQLQKEFDMVFMDTKTRVGGFKYPPNWGNIWDDVDITKKWDKDSLVGLAKSVGQAIMDSAPSVIIAGSRGGQVVLPLLLKHYWRGPFVCINAGPLTSNSRLPKQCTPWFVTCGNDFFPTKSLSWVREAFAKLSDVQGVQIHSEDEMHTPDLNKTLLLSQICQCLLGSICPTKTNWGTNVSMHVLKPQPTLRLKRAFTVNSQKATRVILRRSSSHKQDWVKDAAGNDVSVKNSTRVCVTSQALDEKGYLMYHISNGKTRGWMYAMNFKEHQ
mgnify:CR=1 FL=1